MASMPSKRYRCQAWTSGTYRVSRRRASTISFAPRPHMQRDQEGYNDRPSKALLHASFCVGICRGTVVHSSKRHRHLCVQQSTPTRLPDLLQCDQSNLYRQDRLEGLLSGSWIAHEHLVRWYLLRETRGCKNALIVSLSAEYERGHRGVDNGFHDRSRLHCDRNAVKFRILLGHSITFHADIHFPSMDDSLHPSRSWLWESLLGLECCAQKMEACTWSCIERIIVALKICLRRWPVWPPSPGELQELFTYHRGAGPRIGL
ncbi:hypothetical protein B0T21DRAFT_365751, partial [Apiosordaria backusii]